MPKKIEIAFERTVYYRKTVEVDDETAERLLKLNDEMSLMDSGKGSANYDLIVNRLTDEVDDVFHRLNEIEGIEITEKNTDDGNDKG